MKLVLTCIYSFANLLFFKYWKLQLGTLFNTPSNRLNVLVNQSKPFIVTGYFSSIKYLWIIIILYIFRDFKNSYPVILLIIGISLQFMLGGDTTRFVSFMFLGLIFVVEKLKTG